MINNILKIIKIPTVLECWVFDENNQELMLRWLNECGYMNGNKYAQIFTLEGMKTAYLGYHIVKNINGSFEVFHPDIFKSEYTIL
jgi:hypothetical protein